MARVGKVVLSAFAAVMLVAISAGAAVPVDQTRLGPATVPVVSAQGIQVNPIVHAFAPLVVLDDFNRADGPLGPNWVVRSGGFGIISNAARGSGSGLATFAGESATALEADVAANGAASADYVTLVLDYANASKNLFLKVQVNSSTSFDTAGCYVGNNGSNGSFGLGFFNLSAPFSTAHMRVEQSGTTVTMTFSNIDGGAGTQVYTCNGAPTTGGAGIGIGGFNNVASLDNFAGEATPIVGIPTAGSVGLLLLALALLASGIAWLVRRA
jgi:hypothetical protein